MKVIRVREQSLRGAPKTLLNSPLNSEGEINEALLETLFLKKNPELQYSIERTLERYFEKEQKWLAEGKYTKKEIQEKTEDAVSRTIEGVLREQFCEEKVLEYEASAGEKMCMLLSTDSREPREEHAILEYEKIPCTKAFELVSAYGCGHDVGELNPSEF